MGEKLIWRQSYFMTQSSLHPEYTYLIRSTPIERDTQAQDPLSDDIVFVNIWNNDDGQLKLSHQKPVLRETFDSMKSNKNFSMFSNYQTQDVSDDIFSNIFSLSPEQVA